MEHRKLRMGMIGGGQGAFIGAVHRMGAMLDCQIELVCGAFSSDPDRSISSGRELFLPTERCYGSFQEMIETESTLSSNKKMDFVSIVTPNHMHAKPALMAMDHGFPVIIDKPLCFTLEEATDLREKIKSSGLPFAVTYTYSAYPMVKQARAMVLQGEIGHVRKIMVEYPQGWLTNKLEDTNQKQAAWRSDPKRAGRSNCFGDIGTHLAHMAEYVSGLKIKEVLAELNAFVPGRTLDDDANVLLHFEGGAKGVLSVSQVATGEENNVKIRIYGEKGGLEWRHGDHNTLLVMLDGKPTQIYRAGGNNPYLSDDAMSHIRTPAGHPEGYIEAFANIYRNFAYELRCFYSGVKNEKSYWDFPGIEDGVKGMAMIDAVLASSNQGNVWTEVRR